MYFNKKMSFLGFLRNLQSYYVLSFKPEKQGLLVFRTKLSFFYKAVIGF